MPSNQVEWKNGICGCFNDCCTCELKSNTATKLMTYYYNNYSKHLLCRTSKLMLVSICNNNNWGEPERAPHRRVERSQSIYYVFCMVRRTSVTRGPPYIIFLYGTSYVRHPRAAIDIALVCAIYSMCAI